MVIDEDEDAEDADDDDDDDGKTCLHMVTGMLRIRCRCDTIARKQKLACQFAYRIASVVGLSRVVIATGCCCCC